MSTVNPVESSSCKGDLKRYLPYLVCLLGASFYLYEFILQVSTAVITHELMRDLGLKAAGVGLVSAFYYAAYAPMQIPAGLLYDRYGPRILLTLAVIVCALGAFLFTVMHSIWLASLGRFLMGAGSAFSFIGALVLVSRWFPPRYFATMAGIVQLLSSVGAILGGMPLAVTIDKLGWRTSLFALGVIGMVLSVFIWSIVRDYPPDAKPAPSKRKQREAGQHWTQTLQHELGRLKTICAKTHTWFIGAYTFLIWAPILAFAGLWGVPYLKVAYGVDDAKASIMIALIWIGIGLGSPLIGWISDKLGQRRLPLIVVGVMGLMASIGALYLPGVPAWLMMVFLFLIGCAASGQAFSFAVVNDLHPRDSVGTAIGFNNMATVAGGLLFQPLIGFILGLVWHGQSINDVPVYDLNDYRIAMSVLPLCYVACIFLAAKYIPETNCVPQYET